MTAPTHVSFAEFVYLLVLTTTGVALSFVNSVVIAIAAVLPDIDTGASTIGRLLPGISGPIERRFGHRTLTHSAAFMVCIAFVLLPLLAWDRDLYVCFLAGYATHPFLDTMTYSGVKLFYPFSPVRCVFPFDVNHPGRYRTRSGSRLDRVLGLAFLLACIPTFLVAREGYERFVRYAQRNIDSAVRDYNEFSRSSVVFASISAHNLLTKERVEGRFEVVGALNSHTLLFRGADGALHSLGNEYQAEYVAETALCERGDPVTIVVRRINMENLPLGEVRSYCDSSVESLLFGELTTPDHGAVPQEGPLFAPLTGTAGTLRFNYASIDDIKGLKLENVFITKGTLTLRTLVMGHEKPKPLSGPFSSLDGSHYSRVGCEIDRPHALKILCRLDDTVMAHQVLVEWGEYVGVEERIRSNDATIALLREELYVKQHDVQGRVGHLHDLVEMDSVELRIDTALMGRRFVPGAVATKAAARLRLSRSRFMAAARELWFLKQRTATKIRKLILENESLARRTESSRERYELRSPFRGIVVDVRQEEWSGRVRISILLRKL